MIDFNTYPSLKDYLKVRANVMVHDWKGRFIVVYDDHRWLLNVLFAMQKYRDTIPNLIYFDAHDDYSTPKLKASELLKSMKVQHWSEVNERIFQDFVEFEANIEDGNWLRIACELNMVNDVTLIGGQECSTLHQDTTIYTSEDNQEHKINKLSLDLNGLFDHGGKFDPMTYMTNASLHEFFSIEKGQPHVKEMNPYIVDFDLDCFSVRMCENYRIPWNQNTFEYMYPHVSKGRMFLQDLLSNAQFITICREPEWCGGIGNSNQILNLLDCYLFDGALKTVPAI